MIRLIRFTLYGQNRHILLNPDKVVCVMPKIKTEDAEPSLVEIVVLGNLVYTVTEDIERVRMDIGAD